MNLYLYGVTLSPDHVEILPPQKILTPIKSIISTDFNRQFKYTRFLNRKTSARVLAVELRQISLALEGLWNDLGLEKVQ